MATMGNTKRKQPQTPLPSYLMTPPSTYRPFKRVRFGGIELIDSDTASCANLRRSTKDKEGESPNDFFEDFNEGSETELFDSNDYEESISSTNDNTATPSPTLTTCTVSILSKHDPFSSLALAIDIPIPSPTICEPFRFLDLPLSIRNKVYTHLLVIPALICIRQNHTSCSDEKKAFLYMEHRAFLPGIAYALPQIAVSGFKTRFSRFHHTNIAILRTNKEVFSEAKAVLYGRNQWEIVRPTNELIPPPDYSVRLFPPGCQRLVTQLSIKIRSFYDLNWLLLEGGYNKLKNFYRGLASLTLILELEAMGRGFGKKWAKTGEEKWTMYVQRLENEIAKELFRNKKQRTRDMKVVPTWVHLRVLFDGESYTDESGGEIEGVEQAKREELRQGMAEAMELFKKGGK